MLVLGIESTCDETACALVKEGREIYANEILSQTDLHQQYGGVFPELACRRHIDSLIPVIQSAMEKAPGPIDLIAVSYGPGLIGPLLIGLNAAKALSFAWKIPFIGVNHVEAHLYAAMMPLDHPPFPALGVVISGGHTFMVKMTEICQYELIGTTQDDAIGEAFDKVATLLGLPYPGGPEIEALAKRGDPTRFPFKPGRVKNHPWDFSFSGLKTNVLYTVKGPNATKESPLLIQEEDKPDIAAAFQETALSDIVAKSLLAAKTHGCQAIYCGGGVSNNEKLKELFRKKDPSIPVFYPEKRLTLDNAAMIAGLGYHVYMKRGKGDPLDLEPKTRISL
ncbi:MAG: tRNA (adenosine(37)-N6)-threonylcarbamoyltransferase complex transferase subunit TsaD [Verrucomicrobia bacterium]|nr:tRNA (adenosine(37)-N6)-threonylcarbamoyltransferase complex transferase subunit TsaD [Verrucomicrobiota bacterium]